MKKTILITGATGYLGGRIAKSLSKNNSYFLRLTSTGNKIKSLRGLKNSENIVLNLLAKGKFDKICSGVKVIIHLAAMNSHDCEDDPVKAVLVNTVGTLRLLEAARRQKVKKFIYFSTAHVYGRPLTGKITESLPTKPAHPYSITHRAAEDFVLSENDPNGLSGTVIRLSNAVGTPIDPGVNCWSLIANVLCRQAAATNKLVLETAGLQSRDFISIENVYQALAHILSLPDDAIRGQIFNLGSGKSMRIIDLAKLIQGRCKRILGSTPEIKTPDSPSGKELQRLDYRIDKIKSTGFKPIDSLTKEIDNTLIFCQRNFSNRP